MHRHVADDIEQRPVQPLAEQPLQCFLGRSEPADSVHIAQQRLGTEHLVAQFSQGNGAVGKRHLGAVALDETPRVGVARAFAARCQRGAGSLRFRFGGAQSLGARLANLDGRGLDRLRDGLTLLIELHICGERGKRLVDLDGACIRPARHQLEVVGVALVDLLVTIQLGPLVGEAVGIHAAHALGRDAALGETALADARGIVTHEVSVQVLDGRVDLGDDLEPHALIHLLRQLLQLHGLSAQVDQKRHRAGDGVIDVATHLDARLLGLQQDVAHLLQDRLGTGEVRVDLGLALGLDHAEASLAAGYSLQRCTELLNQTAGFDRHRDLGLVAGSIM